MAQAARTASRTPTRRGASFPEEAGSSGPRFPAPPWTRMTGVVSVIGAATLASGGPGARRRQAITRVARAAADLYGGGEPYSEVPHGRSRGGRRRGGTHAH